MAKYMMSFGKQILIVKYGFVLLGLVFYVYTLFYYPFSFNFDVDVQSEFYYFLPYSLLLLFLSILSQLIKPERAKFHNIYLVILFSITLIGLFILFLYKRILSNEHLHIVLAVFIILLSLGLTSDLESYKKLLLLIQCLFFIQLTIAIIQCVDTSFTEPLAITGSLRNSGVLSCYLVVHIPLVYFYFKFFVHRHPRFSLVWNVIFLAVVILLLIIVITAQSRTAILSFFCVTGYLFYDQVRHLIRSFKRMRRQLLFIIVIVFVLLITTVTFSLFKVKSPSAFGRLMKWEIALQHSGEDFWLGTGLGKLTLLYPQWQAKYFETHTNPKQEYYFAAGESYIIFNEYIQLFKETGMVGILVFGGIIFLFFRSKSQEHGQVLKAVKGVMMAILICGFTSYPFHTVPLLFLFFTCLNVLLHLPVQVHSFKLPSIYKKSFQVLTLVVTAVSLISCLEICVCTFRWHQIKNSSVISFQDKANYYGKLYRKLNCDGKFLYDYGEMLMQNPKQYQSAVKILEESKGALLTYRTVDATARAYQLTGDYENAYSNYEFLSWYLPNRVRPKYEMVKNCVLRNDFSKAKEIAHLILTMPIKIPSLEVDQMKQEVAYIMKTYNIQ